MKIFNINSNEHQELEFYSSDWLSYQQEHERKEFLRNEKARRKLLGLKSEEDIEEENEE